MAESRLPPKAIAITGIGVVSALGTGRAAAWEAARAGDESGVRVLAADDPRRARATDASEVPAAGRAGWVRGFDPREHVHSPQLRRMDWGSRMVVAAARQAFDDAGLLPLDERARAGLAVGSCYGNQRETESYLSRVFTAGLGAGQPFLFPNLVLNAAGGYAAIELGIEGPNLSLSAHEASGETAVAAAADLLRSGACDVACAGGFDELGRVYLDALADRRMLAAESLPPDRARGARGARRRSADGIVPGEGAAMVLLEPLERARARGAHVYALLACARTAAVAAPPHLFARDPADAARRMVALASGERDVTAVFGGADGSRARAALDEAVLRAFADRQGSCPAYVPFRRMCGEWGAAGALGVALGACSLDAGLLPGLGAPTADAAVPERILVVGAARGGVVAPVVLERLRG
ncbi:MAG TPA: beta-ketoacyl synthase N-terminal-like domain-containing protein [Candidatus Binatia bacterium]|nr:beta-ketoacyl synthase N-terminal-like domain-containing protein [Candidatus Binatia bacterium]